MDYSVSTEASNSKGSDNPHPEDIKARTFWKTTEMNGTENSFCPSCVSESSASDVLSSVFDTLKESLSAFRNLHQTADKGMAELKSFTLAMIQEEKQTNLLLEALLHKVTKQAGSAGPSSWAPWASTGIPPTWTSINPSPPLTSASSSSLSTFVNSSPPMTCASSPCLGMLTCPATSASCGLLIPPRSSMPPAEHEAPTCDPSHFTAGERGNNQGLSEILRQESLEVLSPTVREDGGQSLSLTGTYDSNCRLSHTGKEDKGHISFQAGRQDIRQGLSEPRKEESDKSLSDTEQEESDKRLFDTEKEESDKRLSDTEQEESDKRLSDTEKEESDQRLSDTEKKENDKRLCDTDKGESDKRLSDTEKDESDKRLSDTEKEESDKRLSDSEKGESDKRLSDTEKEESDKRLSDTEKEESDKRLLDTEKEESDKRLSDTEKEESDKRLSDTEKGESDKRLSDTEKEESDKRLSDTEKEESDKRLSDTEKEESDKRLSDTEKGESDKRLFDTEKEENDKRLSDTEKEESDKRLSDTEKEESDKRLSDTEKGESDKRLSDTEKDESDKRLSDTEKEESDKRLSDTEKGECDKRLSDTEKEESDKRLSDTEKEESDKRLSDTGKEESDKRLLDTVKDDSDNHLSDTEKEESDKRLSDTEKGESDKKLSDTGKEESDKRLCDTEKGECDKRLSDTEKEESDKRLSDTEKEESDKRLSDTGKEESDKRLLDTVKDDSDNHLSDTEKEESDKRLSDTEKGESDKKLSDTGKEESDKRLCDTEKDESDKRLLDTETDDSDKQLSDTEKEECDKRLSDIEKKESDRKLSDTMKDEREERISDTEKEKSDKELSDTERVQSDQHLSQPARAEIDEKIIDTEINEGNSNHLTEKEEESGKMFPDAERMENDQELSDFGTKKGDHFSSLTARAEADQGLSGIGEWESVQGLSQSVIAETDQELSDTGRPKLDQESSDARRMEYDVKLPPTEIGESDQELSVSVRVEDDSDLAQEERGRTDEDLDLHERMDNDEELSQTEQRENSDVDLPQATPSNLQNTTDGITFLETVPDIPAGGLSENTDSFSFQSRSLSERPQSCQHESETEKRHRCHISDTSEQESTWSRGSEREQQACSVTDSPEASSLDCQRGSRSDCRMPVLLQSPPASSSEGPPAVEESSAQKDDGSVERGDELLMTQRLINQTQTHKAVQDIASGSPCNIESSLIIPQQDWAVQRNNSNPESRHNSSSCSPSVSTRDRIVDQVKDTELALSLSAQYLELRHHGLEAESRRLQEAFRRAQAPDPDPSPKAPSYDTVLCLDVSESMKEGGAFDNMVSFVNDLINGIEDKAYEVEENIAVVTFGAQSNVVQHLTNDFERVRTAIERIEVGGRSPFYEAMVVCIAAFDGKGGTVSVSGDYDVHPRIIFITDGLITESTNDTGGLDRAYDASSARAKFSRLMMNLSPKKNPSTPNPIIFIPVGSQADKKFLQSCATMCDGQFVEPENITALCNYFRVQETIGKVIVRLRSSKDKELSDDYIQAVAQNHMPNHSKEDMTEIIRKVKEELSRQPCWQDHHTTDPTNLDDVFENKEGVAKSEQLPLGTRVVRGPGWTWGNQDQEGPGMVLQHEDKKHPFTWVLWDLSGRWNRYPYGPQMGYHLKPTDQHPVFLSESGQLEIGMTVVKGAGWNTAESPSETMVGVIIRKSQDGKHLKVRWQNGDIVTCPVHAVEFRDPFVDNESIGTLEKEVGMSLEEELFGHSLDYSEGYDEEEEEAEQVPVWQWKDDREHWHVYLEEENECLEKAFTRKVSSCVIQRNGEIYRVNFRRMIERHVDKKIEREVQRIIFSLEDYKSLLHAEKLSR